MPDLYRNFAFAALASAVDDTTTALSVVDASLLPTTAELAGLDFWMTVESAATIPHTFEIVKVTAVTGNVLTVVRGAPAFAHAPGTMVKASITAGMLQSLADDIVARPTVAEVNTLIAAALVPPNVAPSAAFTFVVTDLGVDFDASTSTDSDGTVTGYAWDFGDGGSGSGATTSHTYTAAGTYTATLTVTDNGGLTDTVSHDVTVTDPAAPAAMVVGATATPWPSAGTNIDLPAGSQAGDLAILSYFLVDISPPSITYATVIATSVAGSHRAAQAASYTLQAADITAGHLVLPLGTDQPDHVNGAATLTVYRGVTAVDTVSVSAGGNPTAPSMTPSGPGFLHHFAVEESASGSNPVGTMGALANVACANATFAAASGTETYTAGATVPRTWTWVNGTGSTTSEATGVIALRTS